MPSELDPLLPSNPPAPEIRGYGYSTGKEILPDTSYLEPQLFARQNSDTDQEERDHGDDEEDDSQSSTATSALSTLGSIFTIVVFFAFVVLLLSPESQDDKPVPLPKRRSFCGWRAFMVRGGFRGPRIWHRTSRSMRPRMDG